MIDKDLVQLVTQSPATSGSNYGTGIIIQSPTTGKILLAKRTDTGNYCSPGGKVEVNELVLSGVVRETYEESHIILNSCALYSYEMHTSENGKNWVSFMFYSDNYDDSKLQNQASEVEEWNWYTIDEALGMDLFPPTRKSLERLNGLGLLSELSPSDLGLLEFEEAPTNTFPIKDTTPCAYSYVENLSIF